MVSFPLFFFSSFPLQRRPQSFFLRTIKETGLHPEGVSIRTDRTHPGYPLFVPLTMAHMDDQAKETPCITDPSTALQTIMCNMNTLYVRYWTEPHLLLLYFSPLSAVYAVILSYLALPISVVYLFFMFLSYIGMVMIFMYCCLAESAKHNAFQ